MNLLIKKKIINTGNLPLLVQGNSAKFQSK